MSASATITDLLLRRAFGQRARLFDSHWTVEDWRASFCACPRLRSSGTGTVFDDRASPLGSAHRSRDAAQRFLDEPSWVMGL